MDPVLADLYRALQERDIAALHARLHPEFEGRVAPGMPLGVGGVHRGPEAMLAQVWGAVAAHLDTAPYPESWETTEQGTMVVTGHYRGTAASTGRPRGGVHSPVGPAGGPSGPAAPVHRHRPLAPGPGAAGLSP